MNYLGIELGSTRIKAVLIDEKYVPVSSGDHTWQSTLDNGVWTYDLADAWAGLKDALSKCDTLTSEISAMGISAMMHGYLAFDEEWNLLVPFRTWQNTITGQAAAELSAEFKFNIPQRWSAAHLYQAILNGEEHVGKIAHITTLAGYIHYMLTGVNAVGIGEASGMFPIDEKTKNYNSEMLDKFDALAQKHGFDQKIISLLPKVLTAGECAGKLTEKGSALLEGLLPAGVPFAPVEGDAGTGMTATNSVAPRTGNVSAGTSIFSMVVLEKELENYYEEIDVVTTPEGAPVAMVHCNNCTPDSNEWINMLGEAAALFAGSSIETGELYTKLYEKSLEGDADCGGVMVCNYLAGEGVTHMDAGVPLTLRRPGCRLTLANFIRSMLYSSMSTLKLGMMKLEQEHVVIDSLTGHGGLFKTAGVAQKYMAAACKAPVSCMETAGEGGPYGMALLAAYMHQHSADESLGSFLETKVFAKASKVTEQPDEEKVKGFDTYISDYLRLLEVERKAVETM